VNSRLKLETKTAALAQVAARYATAITPAMQGLIDPRDLLDPIARQFVPSADEATGADDESADPIGDHAHSPIEGVVHRYDDRALLKLTHVCPVYCRFCFRREMVGPGRTAALSPQALDRAIDYIAATPALWEIILTGGDPLILSPRRLGEVTRRLSAIEHVKVLRWHTRVPVVAPERITAELVAALKAEGASTWVALHANHPRELTPAARAAIARLVDAGIPLVSQSVLLRGINDDPETLEALMRAFVEARVKPYYLHHLDRAPGTSHFRISIARGQELALRLHDRASGLCQPSYVLDIPGGHGKAPLRAASVHACEDGYRVRTRTGAYQRYRE
jgi:lysine 2,3-aminomutase